MIMNNEYIWPYRNENAQWKSTDGEETNMILTTQILILLLLLVLMRYEHEMGEMSSWISTCNDGTMTTFLHSDAHYPTLLLALTASFLVPCGALQRTWRSRSEDAAFIERTPYSSYSRTVAVQGSAPR